MEMIEIIITQLIVFNLSYAVIKKISLFNLFLDDNFKKLQSFHKVVTPRVGGVLIFLSFIISVSIFLEITQFYYMIILFMIVNFILGTLDDIKIIVNPFVRLFLFFIFNILLIIFFDLNVKEFKVFFLDYLNTFYFFSVLITFFCIFFIVNGSNLIDGFNGLLGIHILLILGLLAFISFEYIQEEFLIINITLMLAISIFLFFNIPNAKIFLGDGGSYLIGSYVSILIINLYNQSVNISPFFFAIIIFYLFFEIFFSVFRKIFQKKNPFYPDRKHLHMLLYKYLQLSKIKFENYNFLTSIIINIFYLVLVFPSIFIYENDFLCQIYFIFLIIIYLLLYFYLNYTININEKKN